MGSYAVAPFVQWNLNNWIWQVASFIPQSYGATPNFSKIQIRHLVGFTFKKGTKVAWQLTHVDSHVIVADQVWVHQFVNPDS